MDAELITAPGRFDILIRGDRFASYDTGGSIPGFTALYAAGLRPVTQTNAVAGRAVWVSHDNIDGVSFSRLDGRTGPSGRIVTTDVTARRGSSSVGFRHVCAWVTDERVTLLNEVRTIRAASGPSAGAILDIDLDLQPATDSGVTFGRSADALLCVQIASSLRPAAGGQLRNSNEDFGVDEIHGRQAAWCACNGVVNGETVGIAFLDHPNNPWYPSTWLCREDGVLSPSPFPWRAVELSATDRLTLRYRIIVHSGYVEAGWIQARMIDWVGE